MGQTNIRSIALNAKRIVFLGITFPGFSDSAQSSRPLQIAFPLVAFVFTRSFCWRDGLSTVTYDREPVAISAMDPHSRECIRPARLSRLSTSEIPRRSYQFC